jgi:hypothetical protein
MGVRRLRRARHTGRDVGTGRPRRGDDMIRLQWNGLRPGDHVEVHDDTDPAMALTGGTVELVQTAVDSNDLAIRIRPLHGPSRVVRPRRLAVHLLPHDPGEDCWRCRLTDAALTPA